MEIGQTVVNWIHFGESGRCVVDKLPAIDDLFVRDGSAICVLLNLCSREGATTPYVFDYDACRFSATHIVLLDLAQFLVVFLCFLCIGIFLNLDHPVKHALHAIDQRLFFGFRLLDLLLLCLIGLRCNLLVFLLVLVHQ